MSDVLPRERKPLRAHRLIEPGDFSLTSERVGEVHSIHLFGELDLAAAGAVQDALTRAETSDASAIVVDLSELTFIDSTGIRLLFSAAARSRADADRLVLRRGGAAVQRVFQLTALEERLPFTD
jgi:anti-anti-sigma factor